MQDEVTAEAIFDSVCVQTQPCPVVEISGWIHGNDDDLRCLDRCYDTKGNHQELERQ